MRFIYCMKLMPNIPLHNSSNKLANYVCHRCKNGSGFTINDTNGNILGNISIIPEHIYDSKTFFPDISGYTSLYIRQLFVQKEFRNKGIGKALLDMAAKESLKYGCEGRMHLIAQPVIAEPTNKPQIFYRKYGFDSQNKWQIEALDKAIKENTPLPPARWITAMYYKVMNMLEK